MSMQTPSQQPVSVEESKNESSSLTDRMDHLDLSEPISDIANEETKDTTTAMKKKRVRKPKAATTAQEESKNSGPATRTRGRL